MINRIQANKNLLWITQDYLDTFTEAIEGGGTHTTSLDVYVSNNLPTNAVAFGIMNNLGDIGLKYLQLVVGLTNPGKRKKLPPILNSNFSCYTPFHYDDNKYRIAGITVNITESTPFFNLCSLFNSAQTDSLNQMVRLIDITTNVTSTGTTWTLKCTIYYLYKHQ